MNRERMERAQFAAELRRKGTLLSDEAIGDVCEALLEFLDDGWLSLELHQEITAKLWESIAELRSQLTAAKRTAFQAQNAAIDLAQQLVKAEARGPGLDAVIRNGERD